VFYIFKDNPLSSGILDMEELADTEIYEDKEGKEQKRIVSYMKGPYNFSEAYEFGIVIKQLDTHLNFVKI
jgi:hypothetical protein